MPASIIYSIRNMPVHFLYILLLPEKFLELPLIDQKVVNRILIREG